MLSLICCWLKNLTTAFSVGKSPVMFHFGSHKMFLKTTIIFIRKVIQIVIGKKLTCFREVSFYIRYFRSLRKKSDSGLKTLKN